MKNLLDDVQLVDVSLTNVGTGVVISLVDSGTGTRRTTLDCKEIVIFQWHRTPPDDPPYIIPELYWREVDLGAIRELLLQLRYSFCDDLRSSMLGQPALPATDAVWCRFDHSLIHLHLEGAVCADIICGRLEVQTNNN